MVEEVGMMVFAKDGSELDYGKYNSYVEALGDAINFDIPKGRYVVLDNGIKITTVAQAKKLLKAYK